MNAIKDANLMWPDVPVGGVINCGGIGDLGMTIDRTGMPLHLDKYRKVIEINLVGTFNVCRLVASRLIRDVPKPIAKANEDSVDLGVIINTASVAAFEGQSAMSAYSASKFGVISMTLPMARDLARYGIRVMTLAPGLFNTPMSASLADSVKKRMLQSAEFLARMGNPSEFAQAVVSIIENPMLNGSHVRLDGAVRMGKL